MKKTIIKPTVLSLVAQRVLLKQFHPDGEGVIGPSAKGRRLRWHQFIRPHALGAKYLIELRYAEGHRPIVLVKAPDIQALAGNRKLPHTFRKVECYPSLCLWWRGEWDPTKPVATTVVPWAGEWFWFFEQWLVSGEWLGGGMHPTKILTPDPSDVSNLPSEYPLHAA